MKVWKQLQVSGYVFRVNFKGIISLLDYKFPAMGGKTRNQKLITRNYLGVFR